MSKRYLINSQTSHEGEALPHFVVEIPDEREELNQHEREQADRRYADGESPQSVAAFLHGQVVPNA